MPLFGSKRRNYHIAPLCLIFSGTLLSPPMAYQPCCIAGCFADGCARGKAVATAEENSRDPFKRGLTVSHP